MKNKNKFLRIFFYMGLLGIGIVAGIAIRHYHNMPLSETINIIDIATLVTTIFLAVYIPEVLDRRLQMTRDKKELLEKHILEYQSLLRRANMLIQDDTEMTQESFLTMQNSLDVATSKLESLCRLIQYSRLGDSFPKEVGLIRKMDGDHKALLITPDGKPVSVYSKEVRQKEGALYNKIDEETTLLIFKISDAK